MLNSTSVLPDPTLCHQHPAEDASWHVPVPLLSKSLVAEGSATTFVALSSRLRRGLPVNILAIGSSLVANSAGCTGPLPTYEHCVCPRCCGTFCGGQGSTASGYGLALLRWLNRTYPHRGHALYNMGEPGSDVLRAVSACPRSLLRFERLDLILLDVTMNPHDEHERALRQLLQVNGEDQPPPALLLTLFAEFTDRKDGGREAAGTLLSELARAAAHGDPGDPRSFEALVRAWHTGEATEPMRSPWAEVVERWAALRPGRRWGATLAKKMHERALSAYRLQKRCVAPPSPSPECPLSAGSLSARYGFALVSLFAAYAVEFETHSHGLDLQMLACKDGLHPNGDWRAERLVAEPLIFALDRALAAAADVIVEAAKSLLAAEAIAARMYQLPAPLTPLPPRRGVLCFTFDSAGWAMMAGGQQSSADRPLHTMSVGLLQPVPTITNNRGWRFVLNEPSAPDAIKPGLVALDPGDVLELELDTSLARQPLLSVQYAARLPSRGAAD